MINTINDYAYVARSECQTIVEYVPLLRYELDSDGNPIPLKIINSNLLEILGDEMNHCLIALFEVASQLGIKIPTDNFPSDLPFKE